MAAAQDDDRIILAEGTYTLTATLNVLKSLTIEGESQEGVIIDASATGASWGINVSADDVTLKNLTVVPPAGPGTRGTSGGGAYAIHAAYDIPTKTANTGLTLQDITINDSNRTAFDIHGFDGVTLSGLTATGAAYGNGIQLSGCTGVTITGCTTSGNAWGGIAVYASKGADLNRPSSDVDFDFQANDVEEYFYVEKEQSLASSADVLNYTYRIDNEYNAPAAAMTYYTDGDLSKAVALAQGLNAKYSNTASAIRTPDGNLLVTPGMGIQAAVNAAAPGDVIEIEPGTYDGVVTINKSGVTLKAAEGAPAKPVLQASGATGSLGTIHLSPGTNNVTVEGLEIIGLDGTPGLEKAAVYFQGAHDGVTLRDNVITADGDPAILTEYGLANTNITIEDNVIDGTTFDTSAETGVGDQFTVPNVPRVLVYMSSGAPFSHGNVVFRGNTVSGSSGDAVNGNVLINLDGSGVTIEDNTFSGTTGTKAGLPALRVRGATTTVSGNSFSGSSSVGVIVGTASTDTAATSSVTGNVFSGTFTAKVANASASPLDATYNYWGDASRPDAGDFAGNVVSLPYFKDAAFTVAGPVRVASAPATGYATIQGAISASTAGQTVEVDGGTYVEDVALNKDITLQGAGAGISVISGPIGGSDGAAVRISATGATVDGFTLTREGNNATDWNDSGLNFAGVAIQGQAVTGTTVSNNLITGNRTAIDINNSNGHTVRNNVITENHTGLIFRNQTDNMLVTENEITANRTVGILFLDASGGDNIPLQSAAGGSFTNNNISGNWYGQVVDRQAGAGLPAPGTTNVKNFEKNWFGSAAPVVSTSDSAEPPYTSLVAGIATAPGGQPDIAGPASANIAFAPLLASGTDTDPGTYGFQGDLDDLVDGIIGTPPPITGEEEFEDLYVPSGTTVSVAPGGSLEVETLNLGQGATLEVTEGELTIGGSTIAGTFTIFNSFGSFNINGDTTFTVSQSLALITDIHVLAGATLTVNGGGELIFDGCTIDSQTPGSDYNIEVEDDGLLTIARSVVTDANIDINTEAASVDEHLVSRIYDSRFASSDVEASDDSKVYHNLFDLDTEAASGDDPGDTGAAFTAVDGWSNVTSEVGLLNRFTLDFGAPADSTRTLDADGNLFVQTGDPVVLKLDVGDLAPHTIIAAEALLGYNSERLALTNVSPDDAVSPGSGWQVLVDDDSVASPLGLIDSALGLELTGPPPNDGVGGPLNVANVNFTAGTEGASVGFFRVQTNREFDGSGVLLKDTRLTKSSGGIPSYLSAFTANSGEIVVDNQAPAITAPATMSQVQPSAGTVDVNGTNYVIRDGVTPVTITFTAADLGLAGLDAADAVNDLSLVATNTVTTLADADYSVSASGTGVVTYTVTLNIPVDATNGDYEVTATVLDRSGNESAEANLGTFEIANEAIVEVELQAFAGSTREVTFVATGGAPMTWTKTVSFASVTPDGKKGSVLLEDVPAGTTAISAKTDWTLRSKKSAAFSPEGVAAVSLTGADMLNGGDLNGDNVINTLDYGVLRYHYNATLPGFEVSDIMGDGDVDLTDFNVLKANFYTVGDAN